VITIVGFTVSIWRIRKSQKASEQTRAAVEAMKDQFQQLSSIHGVREAIATLEEIRRLHREKVWSVLPDRYSLLKRDLLHIRSRTPKITDEQRSSIQGAIQQLSTIESQVESILAGDIEKLDIRRMNDIISEQMDRLASMLAELQNEADFPTRH